MKKEKVKSEFEDLIQDEILRSEKFRGLLLSGILVVMLLSIAINSYYLNVFESNLIKPLQWFILILLVLLIRAMLIRKYEAIWFKKSRRRYLIFLYGNTFFETSIPSVVIIVFASLYNPATALISPVVFFYFLFIMLSIFDLDIKLSIFAGFVAALEYLILALFYHNKFTFSGELAILNMFPIYVAKSLFLLMAGVVAGFVSLKIRKNILSSYRTIQERDNLERVFGQQVSKEIVDEFIRNNLKITSRKRKATIMFLDIRNFSNFCEGKTPEEINKYQNDVLSFMIDIVKQHRGIVNQILGDGFMATFGAPVEDPDHSLHAVKAAKEIIRQLNIKNKSGSIRQTNVGIGIHCGEVVTGNVGTEDRKQYSVTGNTVILASRLEQLNKKFNTSVIVSKDVIDNIKPEGAEFKSLGNVNVKGFASAVEVYRLG